MKRVWQARLRSAPIPYQPLQTVFTDARQNIGQSRYRIWRQREVTRHFGRLIRNAMERQELQLLVSDSNDLLMVIPIPRYPARHHVTKPPFSSSARLEGKMR